MFAGKPTITGNVQNGSEPNWQHSQVQTSISSYAPKFSLSTEKVKPKSIPSSLLSRSCSAQTHSPSKLPGLYHHTTYIKNFILNIELHNCTTVLLKESSRSYIAILVLALIPHGQPLDTIVKSLEKNRVHTQQRLL